jgi:hypothetical protein
MHNWAVQPIDDFGSLVHRRRSQQNISILPEIIGKTMVYLAGITISRR